MMTKINFPTKEEFNAWLNSKPSNEPLSDNWGGDKCPLAKCLLDKGASDPWVIPDDWEYECGIWSCNNDKTKRMPKWATSFALAIDKLGRERSNIGFGTVTAKDCLRILARIK